MFLKHSKPKQKNIILKQTIGYFLFTILSNVLRFTKLKMMIYINILYYWISSILVLNFTQYKNLDYIKLFSAIFIKLKIIAQN